MPYCRQYWHFGSYSHGSCPDWVNIEIVSHYCIMHASQPSTNSYNQSSSLKNLVLAIATVSATSHADNRLTVINKPRVISLPLLDNHWRWRRLATPSDCHTVGRVSMGTRAALCHHSITNTVLQKKTELCHVAH